MITQKAEAYTSAFCVFMIKKIATIHNKYLNLNISVILKLIF